MEIYHTKRDLWGVFSKYHYLTETIPNNGKVYVGYVNNEPVGCVVMNKFPHPYNKDLWKVARIVVLPHWQGYGIGTKMAEKIIELEYNNFDVRITTTLPIMHNYLWNSDKWILRFQGYPAPSTSKKAKMAGTVRSAYLETYRYLNDYDSDDKIARRKCPPELKKVYDKK